MRRIWARMVALIAPVDAQSVSGIHPAKPCSENHDPRAEARRYEVKRIVKPGRSPAKIKISFVFVAHHGIHGICRFIKTAEHRSAKQHVKKRCGYAVRCIFCNGFHGGACHPRRIKRIRITPNDHGNCFARSRQVTRCKLSVYGPALIPEAFGRKDLPAEDRFNHNI